MHSCSTWKLNIIIVFESNSSDSTIQDGNPKSWSLKMHKAPCVVDILNKILFDPVHRFLCKIIVLDFNFGIRLVNKTVSINLICLFLICCRTFKYRMPVSLYIKWKSSGSWEQSAKWSILKKKLYGGGGLPFCPFSYTYDVRARYITIVDWGCIDHSFGRTKTNYPSMVDLKS